MKRNNYKKYETYCDMKGHMIKMEKKLPITEDTNLRSYTYDSYLDAIVSNKYRTGEVRATVKIEDNRSDSWRWITEKATIEKKNDDIYILKSEKYSDKMNGLIYRKLEKRDCLLLSVLYQQYTQTWGNIGIVIFEKSRISVATNFMYQFANFNKTGVFAKDIQGNQYNHDYKLKKHEALVLSRDDNGVFLRIKDTETNNNRIFHEFKLENCINNELMVGINISLYENVYYNWLFQNHILLKYNKNNREVMFEYDTTVQRNWNYYTINYFVEFFSEKKGVLSALRVKLKDYLRKKLDFDYYVEMHLDSYDLSGVVKYKKNHFYHQCLIYGYSDKRRIFYVIGISKGKPIKCQISYDDIDKYDDILDDETLLVSQKYDPEMTVYNFSIDTFIKSLKIYLCNESVIDTNIIYPVDEYYYGIDIYKVFKSPDGLKQLMNDKRISYLISEHKECMCQRLEFIALREYIDWEYIEPYHTLMLEVAEWAKNLQDCVIMYKMTKRERLVSKVLEGINKIENQEQYIYAQLIEVLQKHRKDNQE